MTMPLLKLPLFDVNTLGGMGGAKLAAPERPSILAWGGLFLSLS